MRRGLLLLAGLSLAAGAAWLVVRGAGSPDRGRLAASTEGDGEAGDVPRLEGRGDGGGGRRGERTLVVLEVVDDQGRPVPMARVLVQQQAGGSFEYRVKEGRVEIPEDLLRAGSVVRVDRAVDGEEESSGSMASFHVPETGRFPRTLRLPPSRDLEVTVLDDQGAPVVGALVSASPVREQDALGPLPSGSTLGEGIARLRGLPRVPLWISVSGDFGRGTGTDVGDTETQVTLRLPSSPTIEGRVLDPSGRPLPRAPVTASGWHEGEWWTSTDEADAAGRFRLRSLSQAGAPRLTAMPPEGPEAARLAPAIRDDVPVGSRDVEIRLRPRAEIRGEVRDPSGRPATSFEVLATAEDAGGLGEAHRAGPSREGAHRFALAGLTPGRYRLEAWSLDGEPARAETLVVEAPAEGVVVRLVPAAVVRGQVGEGSTAGLFAWWWWPGGGPAVAEVDRDGTFEIRPVPLGPGTLYVGGLGTDRCALLRGVRPGQGVLPVDLAAAPSVSGRVEWPEGLPLGLVYVVLSGDGFELWEEVPRSRTFWIRGVPPGSYEVALVVEDVRGPSQGRVVAGADDLVLRYLPSR